MYMTSGGSNESSCLFVVQFLVEMLRKYEKDEQQQQQKQDVRDGLGLRLCVFSTINMLMEKFESVLAPQVHT